MYAAEPFHVSGRTIATSFERFALLGSAPAAWLRTEHPMMPSSGNPGPIRRLTSAAFTAMAQIAAVMETGSARTSETRAGDGEAGVAHSR
jgi:hypothetical protein